MSKKKFVKLIEYNEVDSDGNKFLQGSIKWEHEVPLMMNGKVIGVIKPVEENKDFAEGVITIDDPKTFEEYKKLWALSKVVGTSLGFSFSGINEKNEYQDVKIKQVSIVPKHTLKNNRKNGQ